MSLLKEVSSKEQLFIDLLKNASRLSRRYDERLLKWWMSKGINSLYELPLYFGVRCCTIKVQARCCQVLRILLKFVSSYLYCTYVNMCALLSTFLNRLKMKLFPENEWWLHIQIERERWRRRWRRSFMNQIRGHSAVCLLNKQQLFFNKQKVKLQLNFVQLCWNNAKFN